MDIEKESNTVESSNFLTFKTLTMGAVGLLQLMSKADLDEIWALWETLTSVVRTHCHTKFPSEPTTVIKCASGTSTPSKTPDGSFQPVKRGRGRPPRCPQIIEGDTLTKSLEKVISSSTNSVGKNRMETRRSTSKKEKLGFPTPISDLKKGDGQSDTPPKAMTGSPLRRGRPSKTNQKLTGIIGNSAENSPLHQETGTDQPAPSTSVPSPSKVDRTKPSVHISKRRDDGLSGFKFGKVCDVLQESLSKAEITFPNLSGSIDKADANSPSKQIGKNDAFADNSSDGCNSEPGNSQSAEVIVLEDSNMPLSHVSNRSRKVGQTSLENSRNVSNLSPGNSKQDLKAVLDHSCLAVDVVPPDPSNVDDSVVGLAPEPTQVLLQLNSSENLMNFHSYGMVGQHESKDLITRRMKFQKDDGTWIMVETTVPENSEGGVPAGTVMELKDSSRHLWVSPLTSAGNVADGDGHTNVTEDEGKEIVVEYIQPDHDYFDPHINSEADAAHGRQVRVLVRDVETDSITCMSADEEADDGDMLNSYEHHIDSNGFAFRRSQRRPKGPANQSLYYFEQEEQSAVSTEGAVDKSRNVKCEICGVTLQYATSMIAHLRKHTGIRPFKCSKCDKGFTTKANMLRHELTHSGEKPFQCESCKKCFTEKKSLVIHMRCHTGEKPYSCVICGQSFTQKGTLKSHLDIHLGRKGHLCELCGCSFRQVSQLKQHKNRHFRLKAWSCPECKKSFYSKADRDRHQLKHSGARPFSCKTCERTFTRIQYLREHMNQHEGKKPHKCRECSETFSLASAYYRHLTKHRKEGEARKVTPVVAVNLNESPSEVDQGSRPVTVLIKSEVPEIQNLVSSSDSSNLTISANNGKAEICVESVPNKVYRFYIDQSPLDESAINFLATAAVQVAQPQ